MFLGMGGGAMIHFFHHHFPDSKIEAVEIDPKVIDVAKQWFHIPTSVNIRVINKDAFDYLPNYKGNRLDAIYMDTFLKPGAETGPLGIPTRLKTIGFLRQLKKSLNPGGVIAVNLVEGDETEKDVDSIRSVFRVVYEFRVENSLNRVLIGVKSPTAYSADVLRENANKLDSELDAAFSFSDLLVRLSPAGG